MILHIWWKAWGDLVRRLLLVAASLASLVGLLVGFLPSSTDLPWWAVALLVSAGFFFLVFIVFEFLDHRNRRLYSIRNVQGIRRYMHDWIEHGGRVAIWTRDLSWARNPQIQTLLTKKARSHELIICLPELNDLAKELANAGAEVCAYGAGHLESPASRFTIAFFGRDGARVAVGRPDGRTHVIDEFSASAHPAFHLAEDLITLVRSLQGGQTR